MGCLNSKLSYYKLEPSQKANLLPIQGIYYHNEKDAYAKSRTLEAIRKGDLFLFQQTVQQYRVKPSELLSSFSERKGVLHMLAEHNFAQGMSYILDHISKLYSGEAVHIINSQDFDGNTALIICCLHDSVQALEVLLSSEQVDAFVKNNAGKTGLDIALDKESICAKLVSIYVTNDRRLDNCGPQYTLNVSGLSTNWGSANKKEKEDDLESPLPLSEIVKMAESNDLLLTQVSEAVRINPATRLYKRLETQYTPEKGFTDEEFPHDNYSIGGDIDITGFFQGSATLVWERVAKVLKEEQSQVQLFEDMKANDVSQSPIAGCDFYAALAAMTEFPQRIVKVFTTKESNMFGAYSVVFLVCGIAIEIVVDDYFPCIQQQQQNEEYLMLFSKSQSNEIWFSLLEKAMAKLYGSYAAVSNVGIAEAFEMITGMPSAQFELKLMKQKELWNDLVDYSQRNYFVCVGHYRFQTPNKSKHFTIVGVKEVNDMKMVKLRFQYDNNEISRAFVNRVKKWNKDFKEKLGFFENEKDCFYVELKEFVEEFDVLTVCFYHENWIRNRIDVRSEAKEAKFFELTVEKDTEVFVSVHQKLPNFVDEGPEYKLSPVEILVAEDFGDRLQMKACGTHNALVGESTTYASDKIRFHLSQGKYIVRTQVRWTDGESHEFSLSTYSASPITCTKIKSNAYPHFLERVYTELAARSSERFSFNNDCHFVSAWAGSHLWLCAINDGNKTWDLEVVFDTLENLKIVKKYRRDDKAVKFTVKAGEKAVVYLKRLPVGDVMLKWHFVQSWE